MLVHQTIKSFRYFEKPFLFFPSFIHVTDGESSESRLGDGWKQREEGLSGMQGNTFPLEPVKISLVPMMLQSFNAGRRIISIVIYID